MRDFLALIGGCSVLCFVGLMAAFAYSEIKEHLKDRREIKAQAEAAARSERIWSGIRLHARGTRSPASYESEGWATYSDIADLIAARPRETRRDG